MPVDLYFWKCGINILKLCGFSTVACSMMMVCGFSISEGYYILKLFGFVFLAVLLLCFWMCCFSIPVCVALVFLAIFAFLTVWLQYF